MRKEIIVLGATGSIGTQCLDILQYSIDYELVGVSLNSRFENLEPYLFYFDSLKYVAISDEKAAEEFHKKHPAYTIFSGKDSSLKLIETCKTADVFNSLIGNCGLRPTLLAIRQNQDIMLSNKESLVIGSSLIRKELEKSQSHIYPVDSEHVALAKLIQETKKRGIPSSDILSYTVTASGGALRDYPKDKLKEVSPEEVLHHPTWAMGAKITCDSATLVNKGYEVIEASVLFDVPLSKVGAIICRESLVHAQLEYQKDGKRYLLREYSPCSMKVPIAYSLSKGELGMHKDNSEDIENQKKLHFAQIDENFYPAFGYTISTYEKYGNVGMIYYNAVDTLAINCFLKKEISYLQLLDCLRYTYTHLDNLPVLREEDLEDIISSAEEYAGMVVSTIKKQF
jgi:1-deoxy-D-xylulose-5-phosphate reductoisomerase